MEPLQIITPWVYAQGPGRHDRRPATAKGSLASWTGNQTKPNSQFIPIIKKLIIILSDVTLGYF